MPSHTDLESRVLELESENAQLRQQIERLGASFTKDVDDMAGKAGFTDSQLRQREYSLRSMLDNMPAMIGYWDKNLHNRFCNKAYSSWFDVSPEQLLGKHIRELLGEKIFHLNLPYIEAALRGHPQEFERTIPTPDGSGLRYSLAEYIPDIIDGEVQGFFVQVSDITAIKQAESEIRIAAIAFKSQEGIFVTDAHGVILRVNPAFIRITGYTAEEAVGQTPRLLKSGRHDADFYAAMWESVRRTGLWHGEIWNRRKNGEIYPEILTITEVKDEAGKPTNYVAAMIDITSRKAAEERIHNLAFYDELTKLPNRRLLNDRLYQGMAVSKHSGRYGALMFLDLDNFKPINDTHGHNVGDLLLIEVARRISLSVREADTVARFGGDEFVVLLSELDEDKTESKAQARIVAEKIRTALAEPYLLSIRQEDKAERLVEHNCPSSIGIVLFINHEASSEDIIKWADMAMYKAKDGGRNLIRFYNAKD
ncbi:MAG: diguanylate cyclase [Pseudomonadota bacterium]